MQLFSDDPTLTDWTIDWGDGDTDVVSGTATSATHVYGPGPSALNITATGTTASGTVTAEAYAGGGESLGTVASGLGWTGAMTAGSDGSLYVAKGTNSLNDILRYDSNGNFLGVFVEDAAALVWSMTFGPDGDLYAAARDENQVRRFDGTTGAYVGVFATADTPVGVAFGPDANSDGMADLYVLSHNTDQVLVHDGVTGSFIESLSGGITDPFNLAIGPDGGIYVADFGAGTVVRYNTTTSSFETFASVGVGSPPTDLDFDSSGDFLYVAARAEDKVLRFNAQTGALVDVFADRADTLAGPNQIAIGPDGDLHVSNWGSDIPNAIDTTVLRLNGPVAGQAGLPVSVLDVVTSTYSSNTVKAIPDAGSTTSTIVVTDPGVIFDVNVKIDIRHTYDADLDIYLIAPNGTRVELTTDNGPRGKDFKNTIFDDEASTSITAGTAPFTGSYRPEGSLGRLDGLRAAGTWTLVITDDIKGGKGQLNNWSLIITRGVAPSPMVAASLPTSTGTTFLEASVVDPILQEAIARWGAGLTGHQLALLGSVSVQIADLGGTTLGLASGNTITLDDDAAGWGWFVDRTPRSDSEFRRKGDQGEQGRMDLLSVLMHEVGHLLGHDHDEGGTMAETLAAGTRTALPPSVHLPPDVAEDLSTLSGIRVRQGRGAR